MKNKKFGEVYNDLRQKGGRRVVWLFGLLVFLVFLLAWVSREPSIEADGRDTGPRVSRVALGSFSLETKYFLPITVDLKVNGEDHAADVRGKKYKTKWVSTGADSCLMLAPIKKTLSLSGSETVLPTDSSLYPHHKDGLMIVIRCLNKYTKSTDTVYIFT